MLLPPLPSALSARSPDGFVSPWPWEQAVCSLPCPGLPPSARRHPPRPGGGCKSFGPHRQHPLPRPPVCVWGSSPWASPSASSLSLQLSGLAAQAVFPAPLSLSGLLAGPVQPGFGVGMGLADSPAGPLPSPVGHRSPTPASQGLGGGRERPFSLQCILAICLSAFPRLCRPPAWLLLSWPHKSRWEFSGLRVRLTGGEDRLPLTGHVLACIP